MSAKLSQVPGLMGSEAPSGAFPATFSDFFCRLHAEPDEGEDLVVALLEDKLLPRPTGPTRHGHMSTTTAEQLLRQQVRRGVYSRRSFHRRPQPTPEASPLQYCPGYMPSRTASPTSTASATAAAARRRASSIAVSRPPPDVNRFLQSEQQPSSRPVSPRPPPARSRTASMPAVTRHKPMLAQTRRTPATTTSSTADDPSSDYYRVRSFSITPSGIFNLGDSFRSRRSRSVTSVGSTGSGSGHSGSIRERQLSCASQSSTGWEATSLAGPPPPVPRFKVAMLGGSGVGKTSLTCQFTTSEYICAYDTSLDEEFGQKIVSVMLDGQEADLEIIDHPSSEMSVEAFCSTYHPDVFVVVYSLVDRKTLQIAEEMLLFLWKQDYIATRGVILVGNKADLERKREVPMSGGRRLANSCGCKFIETSSGLDHNVDELLVGILAQVQLNPRRQQRDQRRRHSRTWLATSPCPEKQVDESNPPSSKPKPRGRFGSGRRILRHIISGIKRKTRSCENLLVL